MGCDKVGTVQRRKVLCFNSRTHMGCDSSPGLNGNFVSVFQFTHPYGVRLLLHEAICTLTAFQFTHPYGVRRSGTNFINSLVLVSIHAPIWGATGRGSILIRDFKSFNSRTHMGCDRYMCIYNINLQCFNSRTHMGCDGLAPDLCPRSVPVSIHAPIWGATTSRRFVPTWRLRFQFTHPYGVRLAGIPSVGHPSHVSIHAPIWGATLAV